MPVVIASAPGGGPALGVVCLSASTHAAVLRRLLRAYAVSAVGDGMSVVAWSASRPATTVSEATQAARREWGQGFRVIARRPALAGLLALASFAVGGLLHAPYARSRQPCSRGRALRPSFLKRSQLAVVDPARHALAPHWAGL
jgi:hypothetical protein